VVIISSEDRHCLSDRSSMTLNVGKSRLQVYHKSPFLSIVDNTYFLKKEYSPWDSAVRRPVDLRRTQNIGSRIQKSVFISVNLRLINIFRDLNCLRLTATDYSLYAAFVNVQMLLIKTKKMKNSGNSCRIGGIFDQNRL